MKSGMTDTVDCETDQVGVEPVQSRAMRRAMISGIFTMPAVAAFIVILFLVLGRARVSETVTRFLE
jgi:hypothetical protein